MAGSPSPPPSSWAARLALDGLSQRRHLVLGTAAFPVALAGADAGMGLPSVAVGFVTRHAAPAPPLAGFGAVLSAGTVLAVVSTLRGGTTGRRPPRGKFHEICQPIPAGPWSER